MAVRSLTDLLRHLSAHPVARWFTRRLVRGRAHPGNVPETRGMDIERLEDRTHELVNAERINRGLGLLEHVREIRLIARSHSDDMARRDYFSHTSPEGLTAADRGDRAGYDSRHGPRYPLHPRTCREHTPGVALSFGENPLREGCASRLVDGGRAGASGGVGMDGEPAAPKEHTDGGLTRRRASGLPYRRRGRYT